MSEPFNVPIMGRMQSVHCVDGGVFMVEQAKSGAAAGRTVEFPLRLTKPGTEWLVELAWPEDNEGHVAVCGLFHSKDEASARAFYELAERIISCWYVDRIWQNEGKLVGGTE